MGPGDTGTRDDTPGGDQERAMLVIDGLTVVPRTEYVGVEATKDFEAWTCLEAVATKVTAQNTFSTSNGAMTDNILTASSTPSTTEGSDWVRATYDGNTTDAAHDCDLTVAEVHSIQVYSGATDIDDGPNTL